MLKGARKDKPTVTGDGTPLRTLLAGVEVREVRNLVTRNGLTTEVYRSDWQTGAAPVAQTLYVSLRPGAVSAGIWHGVQNLGASDCAFLNFFDRLYEHGNPDEWRLPAANDAIPYRF